MISKEIQIGKVAKDTKQMRIRRNAMKLQASWKGSNTLLIFQPIRWMTEVVLRKAHPEKDCAKYFMIKQRRQG